MKKSRYFVCLFLAATLLFLSTNFILWHGWVSDLRPGKYAGGDLARMGYVHGSRVPRQPYNDYHEKHIEFADYEGGRVDVVTVGDSFTNPGGLGENIVYQDFLASEKSLKVLNVSSLEGGVFAPQRTLVKLLNAGFFEKARPEYVILQSIERYAVKRFGEEMDFSLSAGEAEWKREAVNPELGAGSAEQGPFQFVSMANLKFVLNAANYLFRDSNYEDTVYLKKLNGDFFTVANSDLLLYYHEDVKNLRLANEAALGELNGNLNELADRLAKTGTTLIFMPVPDKFNLYRKYMVEEELPESRFFEELRGLKKKYLFVDTKTILARELEQGTKDLYYADDTHWTSKAIDAIFSPLDFSSSVAENLKRHSGETASPI